MVLLTKARHRPAHLFTGWGMTAAATGALLVLAALACAIGGWLPQARGALGWIGALGISLGIHLAAIGLLAQLVIAPRGGRDQFAIVERIGEPSPKE